MGFSSKLIPNRSLIGSSPARCSLSADNGSERYARALFIRPHSQPSYGLKVAFVLNLAWASIHHRRAARGVVTVKKTGFLPSARPNRRAKGVRLGGRPSLLVRL